MLRRFVPSFGTFWLAAALLAILPGPVPAQERRVALVVGAERYQTLRRLDTAGNDARAVAARLGALGFDVEPLLDPTQEQFIAALDRFEQRLRDAGAALFFYAGHGVGLPGVGNLLLPVDMPAVTSERLLRARAINVAEVLAGMLGQGRVAIMVIDACRDNPLPSDPARGGAPAVGIARGLEPIEVETTGEPRGGAYLVFSAQPGRSAFDRLPDGDRDPNGLFTRYFLRGLALPGQPLNALMTAVRDEVARAAGRAGRKQLPDISDRMIGSGQFTLAQGVLAPNLPPQEPAAPPVPAPVPVRVPPPPLPAGGYPVAVGQGFRDCNDGTCPEMVVIPAGRFLMGSPASEPGRDDDEGPQHEVALRTPLAVGRYHVTVAEYRAFASATGRGDGGSCYISTAEGKWVDQPGRSWRSPGFAQTDRDPVVCVSWEDAQTYALWMSGRTGRTYRLLTEAEWEYAARAGTNTRLWWGEDEAAQCRFANGPDQTAREKVPGTNGWTFAACRDGFAYTSPVGSFEANGFGLKDMAGNAWQWVLDCYRNSYPGASSDASEKVMDNNCSARVLRGGSWNFSPLDLRSANRGRVAPGSRDNSLGFRLARTPAS